MSETATTPNTSDTKPCKMCGEAIKNAARVCIHCQNYQDWRAEINLSSTILALLVALGSVLTVAVPVIVTALTPKTSSLSFSNQGAANRVITILASNSGVRPGTVRNHFGLLVMTKTHGAIPIEFSINGFGGGAAIIEPGKTQLLELIPDFRHLPNDLIKEVILSGDIASTECVLEVHGTRFDGSAEETVRLGKVCVEFQPFFLEEMDALGFHLGQ